MSYQVLARKWRPRSFDTLVGQEHVVRALTHALQGGRLHHAYLFTGTRGVGKTTIARILAKSLNCETGVTPNPCGKCGACLEIDGGRFVDLLEVDAATNTRVDEMRQLLENAVYAPNRGRYKVYVIDEVHMLSNAAFNAMLKTLEEPPEHVKFILATTDPQKIPVTVLSRCLQFNLKQMSQAAIVQHLSTVLAAESVTADELGLRLIARAANGSMRDALSLLDQAIAYGAGAVKADDVSSMLGSLSNDHLYEIVDALIADEPRMLKAITAELATRSLSYDGALAALAELWVQIQSVQFGVAVESDGNGLDMRCSAFAQRLAPEFVQLAYTITLHGRSQLPYAPDPEAGFLMTLLRLYAFRSSSSLSEKKNAEKPLRLLGKPNAMSDLSSVESANRGAQERMSPMASLAVEVKEAVGTKPAEQLEWSALLSELKLAGLARELASHCELTAASQGAIALRLSSEHRHLLNRASQDKLQAALIAHLGSAVVTITLGETAAETPAQRDRRLRGVAQERAVSSIEGDPVVQDIIESLDASLVEASIRPLVNSL